MFRVDAKAECGEVAIGGWAPERAADGSIDKWASRWFATTLTAQNAPWAFCKGEAFRVVSALELLATIVALIAFAPAAPEGAHHRGLIAVTGQTDSMVASLVLGRSLTTSYPLCLVAMEAAAQLECRRLDLSLEWIPRTENEEADALSNLQFAGFDPARRIDVPLRDLLFLVLNRLQEDAADFFRIAKSARSAAPKSRRGRLAPLRIREPW